jgi:oligoendopeptidase F
MRKDVWELMFASVFEQSQQINHIFTKMISLRHQIALNCGFSNYRDFAHEAKNRFDYTPSDCIEFHNSISARAIPYFNKTLQERKKEMNLTSLKPFDLQVDPTGNAPLKPFHIESELSAKTIAVLSKLSPQIGKVLSEMQDRGLLDLSSRANKAPGGYNYPLSKSGLSFIFMNAAGLHKDVITLLHESGHAYQSFLTDKQPIYLYRNPCMEVAEVASMSMELITMEFWNEFYPQSPDLKKAKLDHLEDIIGFFPWMASVDSFQHWIYLNPNHTSQERLTEWEKVMDRFAGDVDWNNYPNYRQINWLRQSHIFTSPFYYIEYGIAQLGALQIWRNYLKNPQETLRLYTKALSIGSATSMKEIYETAGIEFGFSQKLIGEMMEFVLEQMEQIKNSP